MLVGEGGRLIVTWWMNMAKKQEHSQLDEPKSYAPVLRYKRQYKIPDPAPAAERRIFH